MQYRFYFFVTIVSIATLWFVYDLGYRGLVLAAYRNRLFQLRFELFTLAMNGEMSFDSDLYRSLEILFNGLVRYAHTVSYYAYSVTVREAPHLDSEGDFAEMMKGIASLPQGTRERVWALLQDTQAAVARYMAYTSPIFMLFALLASVRKSLKSMRPFQHTTYVRVFEEEAYRAEKRRAVKLAHA